MSGIKARMRITPGELANPMVRSISPMSDLVCGSGSNLVPITKARKAQMNHPIRAPMVPNISPLTPKTPRVPIPAATLEIITTARAWPIAPLSASTSSYRFTSSLEALIILSTKLAILLPPLRNSGYSDNKTSSSIRQRKD